MLFKTLLKKCISGLALLMLIVLSCNKQSPIKLPSASINSDKTAPTLKITCPKSYVTYHTNDTLNIHVEVEDENESNYPSIVISRLSGDSSIIQASYGASLPAKHFIAEMGWLVVKPITQNDTIIIMAASNDKFGNVGKDSVVFYITR